MVGISSRLLSSVIVLSLFYGTILAVYFFSMNPDVYKEWLISHGREVSDDLTVFNMIPFLAAEFKTRFLSVYLYILVGVGVSIAAPVIYVLFYRSRYSLRMKSRSQKFRGVGISLSNIPRIKEPKRKKFRFKLPKGIDKKHKPLLLDILNYLASNPGSFVGEGHKGTLLEHTLGVIEKALNHPNPDPLLLLAAAAHDIGKTTSHVKVGKSWQRKSFHDKESARILVSFDSWWKLDETERTILAYAIRYEHSKTKLPYQIPGLIADEVARTRKLLDQLHSIDRETTKEEKEEILKEIDVGEAVIGAFLKALPEMPFQMRGMKRGVAACGWRHGDYLYLIEHRVRDQSMLKMDAGQAAALGGKYREKGQISAYSVALFEALDERGWLVKKHDTQYKADSEIVEMSVPVSFPLWKISAGTATFNAIYIVKLPEDMRHYYPAETQYTIVVNEPLKEGNRVIEIKPKESAKEAKKETVEIKPKKKAKEPEKEKSAEEPKAEKELVEEKPKETPKETAKETGKSKEKPKEKEPLEIVIAPVSKGKPEETPEETVKEIPPASADKKQEKETDNSLDIIGSVDFVDDDALF